MRASAAALFHTLTSALQVHGLWRHNNLYPSVPFLKILYLYTTVALFCSAITPANLFMYGCNCTSQSGGFNYTS